MKAWWKRRLPGLWICVALFCPRRALPAPCRTSVLQCSLPEKYTSSGKCPRKRCERGLKVQLLKERQLMLTKRLTFAEWSSEESLLNYCGDYRNRSCFLCWDGSPQSFSHLLLSSTPWPCPAPWLEGKSSSKAVRGKGAPGMEYSPSVGSLFQIF